MSGWWLKNHLEKYERQLGLLLMFSMVNDF
jgi:hypothetical protein